MVYLERNLVKRVIPEALLNDLIKIITSPKGMIIEYVNRHTNLIYDLRVTPLDLAEIYLDIEERFKVEIREGEEKPFSSRLETIEGIAEYILDQKKNPQIIGQIQESNRGSQTKETG